MAWPGKIYVATIDLGVYYTDNFVDPSIQPVWTAINTGLAGLSCSEFGVDPFDNEFRQYVSLYDDYTLYRREGGGNWTEILTPADCAALLGTVNDNKVYGFCSDPSIQGRIWAAVIGSVVWYLPRIYAIYSDDYGDTWHATNYAYQGGQLYSLISVRAYGNSVWVVASTRDNSWTGDRIYTSADKASTWSDGITNSLIIPAIQNKLMPNWVYTSHNATHMAKLAIGGAITDLQAGIMDTNARWDCMWFHPSTVLYQRLLWDYKLYVTSDGWSTINAPGVISGEPVCFSPYAGGDLDQIIVGLTINHAAGQDHIIGTLYGEADVTHTGIAGTNCGVAPYTDSIPYTCGGITRMGIIGCQATAHVGSVHTYAVAMPDYTGEDRGIPMEGDRSAYDALNYPTRHTNDINIGIHWTETGIVDLIDDNIPSGIDLVGNKPPWSLVIANDALSDQGVHHWAQQAILSGDGKNFIFYMADDYDTYCVIYHHDTKVWDAPVWVADGHAVDNHNYWSAIMDDNGYFHIFGGCHATDLYYKKSTSPYDISAWSAEVSLATRGTYPKAVKDSAGYLYIFYRDGAIASGGRYLRFRKSTDEGAVWAAAVTIVDSEDDDVWVYPGNIGIGTDDFIHIIWTWRDSGGFNDPAEFRDVNYMRSPDGGTTWEMSDGTNYVLPVKDDASAEVIYSGQYCLPEQVVTDESNNPHAIYLLCDPAAYWTDNDIQYCYLSGGVWQDDTLPGGHCEAASILIDGSVFYVLQSRLVGAIREIYLLISLDNGATWGEHQLTTGSAAHNDEPEFKYNADGGIELVYTQLQDLYLITEDWIDKIIEAAAAVSLALDDLTDVNAPAPNDEDVLTFDTGTNEWKNAPIPSLALDDLSDVNTTGVNTGDIIYKSAGDWVDYPLGIDINIGIQGGKIVLGDIANGDIVTIDRSSGKVRLVGAAIAWDDLRVSAAITKAGATAPSYKAFGPSGSLKALMFEAGQHDEVHFEVQMPHNWLEGSDIYPHVHWTPVNATAGNVVWELEYAWANIDGTFGAPGNMATDATAAGGVAWVHKLTPLKEGGNSYIDGSGKTMSSMLVCRLHRNSNSGNDTLNQDVALLEIDFHYQIDSFGSDTETDKDAQIYLIDENGDYLLDENGDYLID